MSTLFVDRKNIDVRTESGALVFYENGERRGTVPVAPLDRVVFKGMTTLSTKVLGELGSRGIGVIVLTGYKNAPVLFLPSPHNDARRRICQCVLSQDAEFRRLFSVNIIREKIIEQEKFLEELSKSYPRAGTDLSRGRGFLQQDISRIYEKTTMDELRGIEGHAASVYFQTLASVLPASLNFTGRKKRPPTDPFNAVLSLTYTLLVAETALAIYKCGLDPYVGFLHATEFSRESFACDMVEVFRPLADRFALQLFREGTLRPEDFSTSANGCLMGKAARARYYPAYEVAASLWRKLLEKRAMRVASDFITEAASRQCSVGISLSDDDEDIPF